jgi:hypothetical protein
MVGAERKTIAGPVVLGFFEWNDVRRFDKADLVPGSGDGGRLGTCECIELGTVFGK